MPAAAAPLTPPPTAARPWHAMPAEAVVAALDTDAAQGLNAAEVLRRRQRHGRNSLPAPPHEPAWRRLLRQFDNVLIYVLLLAAGVTALTGHGVDALVIAGVTVINAAIGYVQEGRAEAALDAIRDLLAPQAQALREGARLELAAADLVPGDIVLLTAGDRVPADLRLLDTHSLRIEEAALTGESVPVEKSPAAVAEQVPLGDRSGVAFAGTLVSWGQGRGVVVATGAATEVGHISGLLAGADNLATPLLRQLQRFGRTLAAAMLAVAGATFLLGYYWRGYSAEEMLLSAVGLAVALIPEELPALVTITLALGVQRMARRRALVRRLPAVEALGAVTVICTDKTGTLTRNEMTVRRLITSEAVLEVSGEGYAPTGGFTQAGVTIAPATLPLLADIGDVALLCNEAALRHEAGQWTLTGDPTEGALLALALKAGLDNAGTRSDWPRSDTIPFESEHRFMATLHHGHAGEGRVLLKGAPERVLALCDRERRHDGTETALQTAWWQEQAALAAQQGQRLLALAVKTPAAGQRELRFADIEAGGFVLLGLAGIEDPPREEVLAAVASCRRAGIRIKMITGDHAVTARAIGERLGLADEVRGLAGHELDALDDVALASAVRDTTIFARASPEHKLRLVRALQAQGEVVAMTGDGVNDAPALKQADVGVAMGRKGTAAAREAAEIVLADDNFASIAAAVEEGRTVYDNIRKAFVFMLPTNGGEAGLLLLAILLGLTLPITPVQILWVNMVTTVVLGLVLAFESAEADLMARPPRPPREPLLQPYLLWRILLVTGLMTAGCLALFLFELEHHGNLAAARTAAVNALVIGELVYLFSVRRFTAPALTRAGLAGNPWLWPAAAVLLALQGLFTYWPVLQGLFGTAALAADTWSRIGLFALGLLLVVEAEKALLARAARGRRPRTASP